MSLRKELQLSVLFIFGVFSFSCAPSQKIIMKEKLTEHSTEKNTENNHEKDTEHNAVPRPGIVTDRFSYGKAMGTVDILFVVDNTETAEQLGKTFQIAYDQLAASLGGNAARLLDYRVQIVITPTGEATKNVLSSADPSSAQSAEFFGKGGGLPLFNAKDSGFLRPFEATAKGLASKALEGRTSGPLYLVYLLGADSDGSDPGLTAELSKKITEARGLYQTHVFTLTRTTRTIGTDSFPFCNEFQTADKILASLHTVQWRSLTQFDLCDKNWGRFSDELFQSILTFKKKTLLSGVPYQPETMTVRGPARLFRYGDDYRFDSKTNEILFLKSGLVLEGDLLEVAYYLKPGEQVFQGSPTPAAPVPHP